MTACKDSLSGKKAVSATLAGVLAVGMVPAAAFAADADQPETGDIELQATTSAVTAFNNGEITFSNTTDFQLKKAGTPNAYKATANADGSELQAGTVSVTPKGGDKIDAGTANITVTLTKDGEAVSKIVDPGTYTITVKAVDGDYKGGEVSATIEVAGASLASATFFEVNEDDATDVSDTHFMYTGADINFGIELGGKAL